MTRYFKEIDDGNMSSEFLSKLDEAREIAQIPFVINSAWRSVEKNKEVGGKFNSSHLKGLAVDISVTNSRQRFVILESLIKVGFNRIGIADTFIHVDLDKEKSEKVIWTY